ncbi:MAG: acetylxylan esterase [Paenibacillaceae bacterium]|nr:acetylxylan esterase [Paenibacillaceae bacterium]
MSFGPYVNGYYDVGAQLPDYLLRKTREAVARTAAEKAAIVTAGQFEQRRERLRAYFWRMIGGLPETKTPLAPVCTGELERDAYTIRNIVFQSLPGIYVTANLYVPKGEGGPYPAVLFTCGHIEAGKAAPIYQKVCIELANNGFVVLAVDPVSQGERMQGHDPALGRTHVRWHAEHTYLGLQCELAGRHIVRYFVWDLIRAVDYLSELPEVDASRIGVTGNSGGGIQTLMAMIADDRIAAAAPCTYITSRESYMKTGQPQDGEQIWDEAIAQGMDYDDYLTLFAPKPVLVGAVESDFFCVEGTEASFDAAKRVYRLFGREEALSIALAKGTHSFNDELRRAVVAWFVLQFRGHDCPVRLERDLLPEPVAALRCTASGQVIGEYADAVSVQADNARVLPALRERLRELAAEPLRLKAAALAWLRMPAGRDRIRPRVVHTERVDRAGKNMEQALLREQVFFFSEPDIAVGGTFVAREGAARQRTAVLVLDAGADGIELENEWIEQLTETADVFAFDTRGMGAFRSRAVSARAFDQMFGTEYKLSCDARMLGTPLPGMRVFDVLRALDYAAQRDPQAKLSVAGKGFAAIYALLAGVLDDRVDEIELINMPRSFADIVDSRFYRYDVRYHWYNVLAHFDLPELIAAFGGSKRIRVVEMPDVGDIIRF